AAIVLTEDFEGLGNTDTDTIDTYDKYPPNPGVEWVVASNGFGSSDQGANLIGTNNVWSFRYTNSGLTTAFEAIGALQAGWTYTVTFDATADTAGATGGSVGFVTFDGAGTRNAFNGGGISTNVSAVLTSTSYTTGTSITLSYTADGSEGTLGQDVSLRFLGATTSSNIDNITVTAVPEPTAALLGSLGVLLLLRRRRS
ncbi:MAG: hypothetical protein R3242_10405, partial [Akkermansiaceae bacterium]|nr:hypothetical protein [Akkermansiaceae bacterium]